MTTAFGLTQYQLLISDLAMLSYLYSVSYHAGLKRGGNNELLRN